MSAVEKALLSRLTADVPGASLNASLVKWENLNPSGAEFKPPASGLWYRVFFLPGTPQPAGIGEVAPNRLSGVLQVDVLYAPTGSGTKAVDDEASRIMACFKRGVSLVSDGQYVTIQRSYLGPRGTDEPYWKQIVRIEWTADVPN